MYRGRGGKGGGRGKGRGGKGGGGKGGGGKGGKGGGGYNWRQHVEPSTDPDIVNPCRERVAAFLASGAPRLEMAQRLRNVENNTMRAVAQDMGVGWRVRARRRKCARKRVWERMSSELQAFSQTSLKCRMLRRLEEQPAARGPGRRALPGDAQGLCLEGFEDERTRSTRPGRRAAQAEPWRRRRRGRRREGWAQRSGGFLSGAPGPADAAAFEAETRAAATRLSYRRGAAAFKMREAIVAAVRSGAVTLVLGATGCGKTTQIPQFPRRISAASRRASRRSGGALGDTVGFKIRFEDSVTASSKVVFCTVGVLLKTMQSNPLLAGATHVIVDEVHERDVHTDFFLLLVRRLLAKRNDLKVVLMSATVDPSAFLSYFPEAAVVEIPGKTNYPIEEHYLEDILPQLRPRSSPRPRRSPFGDAGALEGVPGEAETIFARLKCARPTAQALADFHALPADFVDVDLVAAVVEHVHASQEDGAILVFVPGWAEIADVVKRLERDRSLAIHALHSRMPSAEQRAIFDAPPPGKRKVVVSTVLAETSITVEDVVHVVDAGKARSTFLNKQSLVSALRTTWYATANGLQRRGRAGRVRPGAWWRLYSSFQHAAMVDYAEPEMVRSPLDELCLEVAALGLGAGAVLAEAIAPTRRSSRPSTASCASARWTPRTACPCRPWVGSSRGSTCTPCSKLLLLGELFDCFGVALTVAAGLGSKSPFVCPLGKEPLANAAKARLADGTDSDHVLLERAYAEWRARPGYRDRRSFCDRFFLSHQTLEYVDQLRRDLGSGCRDLLMRDAGGRARPRHAGARLSSALLAALWPNVAAVRKQGKGLALGSGLKVVCHPGSVNRSAGDRLVVFCDVQETSDRYLYDTSVVSLAQVLLFAPDVAQSTTNSGRAKLAVAPDLQVLVDAAALDDVLATRDLLQAFVQRSVGRPTDGASRASAALAALLRRRGADFGDDDEEEERPPTKGAYRPPHSRGRGRGWGVVTRFLST
ncbi:helicase [Aureococcus anophagefferens]|nr:helicase [Aureococcus anophagefferens]